MEKFYPTIGEHLYLSTRSGHYFVDMVKTPYTVIAVDKNKVIIQEAMPIFNGPRYYDTLADDIVEDTNGKILMLSWAPKKGSWQIDQYKTGNPKIAYFGAWEYYPYLD